MVWCRNRMNYNCQNNEHNRIHVVVWCRNRMNYNTQKKPQYPLLLWFDVEIEWITTFYQRCYIYGWLWFDVEIEWITTQSDCKNPPSSVVVWCRNRMNYNIFRELKTQNRVVVWCRNRMNYNCSDWHKIRRRLWFDVEIEWITTNKYKSISNACCGLM